MTCDVCGRRATVVHGFNVCAGHGRDLITSVLTDGLTPLGAFMALNAEPTSERPAPTPAPIAPSTLPLDRHTYAVRVPGAKAQPAPSRVRAKVYVNGFTHRATNPANTWPTR